MTGDPTPDTSLADARIKLASLFNDSEDLTIAADQTTTTATPATEATAEGNEDDEAATLAAAQALQAADQTGDDDEEDAPPPPRKLKIGDEELDEEEVKKGYLRQSDYTKKTQALAKKTQALDEKTQKFEQEELPKARTLIEQYASQLKVLETAIQEQTPAEPDWVKLRSAVTGDEFLTQWTAWQAHQKQLEQLTTRRKEAEAAVAAEQQVVRAQREEAAAGRLLDLLPDWKDTAVRSREAQEIVTYAEAHGITREQLKQVDVPEFLVILRDATQYQKLKASGKTLAAQSTKAAETVTLTPGATGAVAKPVSKVQKAIQKAAKSGRVEDAAAAMRGLGID